MNHYFISYKLCNYGVRKILCVCMHRMHINMHAALQNINDKQASLRPKIYITNMYVCINIYVF